MQNISFILSVSPKNTAALNIWVDGKPTLKVLILPVPVENW